MIERHTQTDRLTRGKIERDGKVERQTDLVIESESWAYRDTNI